jgi:hypothetical protein
VLLMGCVAQAVFAGKGCLALGLVNPIDNNDCPSREPRYVAQNTDLNCRLGGESLSSRASPILVNIATSGSTGRFSSTSAQLAPLSLDVMFLEWFG